MEREDYDDDLDLLKELHKNTSAGGHQDVNHLGNKFKNPLVESQETRKMELSIDPSF